jgi:hypothetical protein
MCLSALQNQDVYVALSESTLEDFGISRDEANQYKEDFGVSRDEANQYKVIREAMTKADKPVSSRKVLELPIDSRWNPRQFPKRFL